MRRMLDSNQRGIRTGKMHSATLPTRQFASIGLHRWCWLHVKIKKTLWTCTAVRAWNGIRTHDLKALAIWATQAYGVRFPLMAVPLEQHTVGIRTPIQHQITEKTKPQLGKHLPTYDLDRRLHFSLRNLLSVRCLRSCAHAGLLILWVLIMAPHSHPANDLVQRHAWRVSIPCTSG